MTSRLIAAQKLTCPPYSLADFSVARPLRCTRSVAAADREGVQNASIYYNTAIRIVASVLSHLDDQGGVHEGTGFGPWIRLREDRLHLCIGDERHATCVSAECRWTSFREDSFGG